jgi:hypothetical protein
MMNVNNCYMGNLVDEILNFFVWEYVYGQNLKTPNKS